MRQMHIMVLTLILDWLYYFFLCYFLILLFICFAWFHAIAWVDLQPSLTLNFKTILLLQYPENWDYRQELCPT